eukprot:GHRR01018048.1.p1 GENE.GHRR01018048.1~~GHRR01018048.1.p1  ORF type:complete len:209 (+),score=58.77 GHRR01018048.1:192-818(+)
MRARLMYPIHCRYWTIAEDYMHQVELKKSLFITTAWPVTSAAEALAHIEGASDPTASHNCYAFKVAGSARSNDDGEPSGTAGRPILGAIEADGLDGVCVLVVRYFGGTKLGAGGLVRAYASAARDCLRAAPKVFIKAQSELSVTTTFEHLSTVYNLLARYGGKTGAEDYNDKGQVCLQIMLDADQAEPLQQALADATSGRVKARLVGS